MMAGKKYWYVMYYITYGTNIWIEAVAKSQRVSNKTGTHDKTLSSEPVTQNCVGRELNPGLTALKAAMLTIIPPMLLTLTGTQTHHNL